MCVSVCVCERERERERERLYMGGVMLCVVLWCSDICMDVVLKPDCFKIGQPTRTDGLATTATYMYMYM